MNTAPPAPGYTLQSEVTYAASTNRSRYAASRWSAKGMPVIYVERVTGSRAVPEHNITAEDYDLHLLRAIGHGAVVQP